MRDADDQMLSPLPLQQTQTQSNTIINDNDDENESNSKQKHVQFNLTLSQETKQQQIANTNINRQNMFKYGSKITNNQRRNNLTNRPLRPGGIHSLNNSNSNNAETQSLNRNDYKNHNAQKQKQSSAHFKFGGGRKYAAFDDENERNAVFTNSKSKDMMKRMLSSQNVMPRNLIEEDLIKDPMKYCGYKEDESDDANIKKQKKRKNNKSIRKKLGGDTIKKTRKTGKRIAWNDDEIEAVIEGYEKYQQHENAPIGKPGIWSYTLKDPKLNKILSKNGREGRNLKD